MFILKQEDYKNEYNKYLREHPELKAIVADYMQSLLCFKPENVLEFTTKYFAPYSSKTSSNRLLPSLKEQINIPSNSWWSCLYGTDRHPRVLFFFFVVGIDHVVFAKIFENFEMINKKREAFFLRLVLSCLLKWWFGVLSNYDCGLWLIKRGRKK